MEGLHFDKSGFAGEIFDAIPGIVFIVDEDVQILGYNGAAGALLGKNRQDILKHRAGDILHCLHSTETPEGCGRTLFCRNCIIRGSVKAAFQGHTSSRRHTRLELIRDGRVTDFHGLITVSPFSHDGTPLALLIIEDINELMELRSILPICMKCKRVRDDKEFWTSVEEYFNRHLELDFSHGLCPKCFAEEAKKMPVPAAHSV